MASTNDGKPIERVERNVTRAKFIPIAFMASLLALGGCAETPRPLAATSPDPAPALSQAGWRGLAEAEDLSRMDRLEGAWTTALAEAASRGYRRAIRSEGELLEPDAALPRPAPSPGPYFCRTIKLGRQGRGPAYVAYKPFYCYVEVDGNLLTIVKQTGSERPAGRIFPDAREDRLVFMGALALDDEEKLHSYGEEQDRNLIGVVERVAPFRYRLVIPWPRHESKLDVIELIPVID